VTDSPKVVVTGAAGVVGHVLMSGLDTRFDVRGVDRRRPPTAVEGRPVRRGDLSRVRAARRALEGSDVIVDLAARSETNASWRDVHRHNLRSVWNTLDAARIVGARRVVLASSNQVVSGYERDEPYRRILAGDRDGLDPTTFSRLTAEVPVRPSSAYSVGKVLAEAAGRYYAERHGLSVIALRIGTVRLSDRPEEPRHLATLLTHRDLVQLVERCIDAPDDLRFGTFYGVSANTWRIWDLESARERVGFSPQDNAENWRPARSAHRPVDEED
jgi:nucleoside-diphosphate-sugar epimerase